MTTIAYLVGARPNFVKTAPVVRELRARLPQARHVLIHTGQHYEREMAQLFVDELQLPHPDYVLDVGSGSHGAQTARALERVEDVLQRERPSLLFVSGDVNSTLAGALAAVKLGVPVAHIEAGLRSFDGGMPEEINRVLVDRVARWCFTHSPEAHENLVREGIDPERIHFVGNTMIDSLVHLRPRIERSTILRRLGLERERYVLVTLHRPALVDGPLLEPALAALVRLSERLPVVFPLHPRTRRRIRAFPAAPGLHLTEPVGYLDFLALEMNARAVITDSGGVQEETAYLRVPCFTLRDNTERPITITRGTNRLLGLDVDGIDRVSSLLDERPMPLMLPALWDGGAAVRIADALVPVLTEEEPRACVESAAS